MTYYACKCKRSDMDACSIHSLENRMHEWPSMCPRMEWCEWHEWAVEINVLDTRFYPKKCHTSMAASIHHHRLKLA